MAFLNLKTPIQSNAQKKYKDSCKNDANESREKEEIALLTDRLIKHSADVKLLRDRLSGMYELMRHLCLIIDMDSIFEVMNG